MAIYSTILFDLDGTLTDPKEGITKSAQYALSRLGIDEPDLEELTSFIGPPLHVSFEQFYGLGPSEVERAVMYYRQNYKESGIYENVIYDGIPELLKFLKDKSKQLVVATSKLTVFAEQILIHFEIDQYFDHVVGSNLDGSRSNKAEIVEHAIRKFNGSPKSDFIMVGDRKHDIVGANANGIDSIGVKYGYGSQEELVQANATHLVDTVDELFNLLSP